MCVVIGKYFENIGWVGFKNRDRNYVPKISFKKEQINGLEIQLFHDDITAYMEGFNSHGIAILSSALLVRDDEKEVKSKSKRPSLDGAKIAKALEQTDIKQVVASLIKNTLSGHTLVFNETTMYILEGSYRPGEYAKRGFDYSIKEVPHDAIIVRTNHGIELKTAGYQRIPDDENQTMSRVSSESRRLIAQHVAKTATTPLELINNLTMDFTNNDQLNPLRRVMGEKQMRTTSQIMIIPSERTMYVRPVQSKMEFDFWKLNQPKNHTWVEILSNRILHSNLDDNT